MNNSHFVISLDFELLWGIFDKVNPSEKLEYFENTRAVIPEILALFKKYNIRATWATVGMLFNKNWEEWKLNFPEALPGYKNSDLSAYSFGQRNLKAISAKMCFAEEIIEHIAKTDGQEIGTHTYSHFYCLEKGQDLESFKADLVKCIELAKNRNIELKSLVFPRNQFNADYLKVCSDLGITSVRSNPNNWYWQNTQKESLSQKIFRTGDAYFGLNDKSYKLEKMNASEYPVLQPASRLLRPYSAGITNKLKLKRIKDEITHAAKQDEVYHLWWHPHNFGYNSKNNLDDLEEILKHIRYCRSTYGMASSNMHDISKLVTAHN